jgi:MFS family permease
MGVRALPVERLGSARREMIEGLAYVRREPWLWATLISASLSLLFFLGPIEVLLPFVVRNDLGAGAGGYGAVLAATGIGAVATSLVLGQTGVPRRYLTFMYLAWGVATLPFLIYAFGTALWQFLLFALFEGACMTAGMVVWGTLMSTRVPPELRGRVHSLDWFVSIGLTPVSFALVGPVSSAIGIDATLVLAAIAPAVLMLVLYVVAGLRRDEERYADAVSAAPATATSA